MDAVAVTEIYPLLPRTAHPLDVSNDYQDPLRADVRIVNVRPGRPRRATAIDPTVLALCS